MLLMRASIEQDPSLPVFAHRQMTTLCRKHGPFQEIGLATEQRLQLAPEIFIYWDMFVEACSSFWFHEVPDPTDRVHGMPGHPLAAIDDGSRPIVPVDDSITKEHIFARFSKLGLKRSVI